MGTYGREIRAKRACLGNNGGTRGAHWTHKIVTICVTFCVRGGSPACAKRAPDAPCVMCEMCPSWGAIRAMEGHPGITLGITWAG